MNLFCAPTSFRLHAKIHIFEKKTYPPKYFSVCSFCSNLAFFCRRHAAEHLLVGYITIVRIDCSCLKLRTIRLRIVACLFPTYFRIYCLSSVRDMVIFCLLMYQWEGILIVIKYYLHKRYIQCPLHSDLRKIPTIWLSQEDKWHTGHPSSVWQNPHPLHDMGLEDKVVKETIYHSVSQLTIVM